MFASKAGFEVAVFVSSNFTVPGTNKQAVPSGSSPTAIAAQSPCIYNDIQEARAIASRLPAGKRTTCFVDPSDLGAVRLRDTPAVSLGEVKSTLKRAIVTTILTALLALTLVVPMWLVVARNFARLAHATAVDGSTGTGGGNGSGNARPLVNSRRGLGKYDAERAVVSLDGIEKNGVVGNDKVCVICLEEVGDSTGDGDGVMLPCKHAFHAQCIKQWLSRRGECPTCKFNIRNHLADKDALLREETIPDSDALFSVHRESTSDTLSAVRAGATADVALSSREFDHESGAVNEAIAAPTAIVPQ
jgi:hypothetical protein